MKKWLIILMFALLNPATQSCSLLEQLIELQLYGTTYAYPTNSSWNWWNSDWNNYQQITIPQNNNWYGDLYVPVPSGFNYSSGTYYYQDNRGYLNLYGTNGQTCHYSYGWKGSRYIRWYNYW